MPVDIASTTDSQEAVTAAMGDLAQGKPVVETTSASAEKSADETTPEASEALEASETENTETTEETEEQDESEESTDDDAGKKPGKKAGGYQKKINKLTKLRTQAEQEKEYWKAQALKSAQAKPDQPAQPDEKLVSNEGRPSPDNFDTHEKYVEALTDWKLDQKFKERDTQAKEVQVKTEHQKQVEAHVERVKEFSKAHADFNETLEDVNHIPMSLVVQQVILKSEQSAEFMYQLAKHPEEYEKICKLPAIDAACELGKFESRFIKAQNPSVETITTTKAPKPVKPVRATGTPSKKSLDDPNLSQREYEQLREEQIKAARA
jgi:hypothetical protein